LAICSFMYHSGGAAAMEPQVSNRAYSERIRNDKSADQKRCGGISPTFVSF
jgi:hypothetical protein